MKLIFENSYGKERVIAYPNNEEEVMREIYKFCENHNFKIYYVRSWEHYIGETYRKTYDVGSHTEFFHLEDFFRIYK
jgi:hypothetical protein